VDWLTEVFEEPYIKDYAAGNLDAWMGAAGFEAVANEGCILGAAGNTGD
jgi:hypothetical protein